MPAILVPLQKLVFAEFGISQSRDFRRSLQRLAHHPFPRLQPGLSARTGGTGPPSPSRLRMKFSVHTGPFSDIKEAAAAECPLTACAGVQDVKCRRSTHSS